MLKSGISGSGRKVGESCGAHIEDVQFHAGWWTGGKKRNGAGHLRVAIEIDGRIADVCRRAWYPYTVVFDLTGHPAVMLPSGFDRDGLPLAIQLVARTGQDAFLVRVAAVFEQLRPWAQHRPHLPAPDGNWSWSVPRRSRSLRDRA